MFLYSIRKILNAFGVFAILLILFYLFVNHIVVERMILSQANNDEASQKYSNAVTLYNISYGFYKMFHFSEADKEIYFEIPYRRAFCYLQNNQKEESAKSMLEGLNAIQSQYGAISYENAYFIRKYLINFYLDNDKYKLAKNEFYNLLLIYKFTGINNSVIADMIRLKADLYYQKKDYDYANRLYKKAYKAILSETDADPHILVKITRRIANYEVINENYDDVIKFYKTTAENLQESSNQHRDLIAELFLEFGDFYVSQGNLKEAIKCYEPALEIIKKMPKHSYLKQHYITYLDKLKNLYDDDGQYAKARDMEERITKYNRFSFLQIF